MQIFAYPQKVTIKIPRLFYFKIRGRNVTKNCNTFAKILLQTLSKVQSGHTDLYLLVHMNGGLVVRIDIAVTNAVNHLFDEIDEEESANEGDFSNWNSIKVISGALEACTDLK